jgi:hypothetical protein
LARDETGFVANEIGHERSDIFRRADAPDWMLLVVDRTQRFGLTARVDPAWTHDVHAYGGTETQCERMRQRDDAAFRCRVGLRVWLGLKRAGGCEVDDGGLLRAAQQRQGVLRAQEHAGQVRVQDAQPVLEAQLLEVRHVRIGDAGVVHEHVEPAEALRDFTHGSADVALRRHADAQRRECVAGAL